MNIQILNHHKQQYDDLIQQMIEAAASGNKELHQKLLKEEEYLNNEGIHIRELLGLAAKDPCGNQRCTPRRYSRKHHRYYGCANYEKGFCKRYSTIVSQRVWERSYKNG